MIEWTQDKWRIVVPKATMHKFFGHRSSYVCEIMYNRFDSFCNFLKGKPLGIFDDLSGKDMAQVRNIAIGKRNVPLKVNVGGI